MTDLKTRMAMTQAKTIIEGMQKNLQKARQDAAEMRKGFTEATLANARLQAEKRDLETEVSSLKHERKLRDEDILSQQKSIDWYVAELADANRQCARESRAANSYREVVGNLQTEINNLNRRVETLKAALADAQNEFEGEEGCEQ